MWLLLVALAYEWAEKSTCVFCCVGGLVAVVETRAEVSLKDKGWLLAVRRSRRRRRSTRPKGGRRCAVNGYEGEQKEEEVARKQMAKDGDVQD